MGNILSIEKDFLPKIHSLWLQNSQKELTDRGFAIPKEIKKNSILFIGINPSFSSGTPKGIACYDLYSEPPYRYFNKFIEIHHSSNVEWSHWDLLFLRESSQAVIENYFNNSIHKEFIDHQLALSKEVIKNIKPQVIVVCNTKARDIILDKSSTCHFDLLFDNEIGTYLIKNDEKLSDTPVFLTSMLTGQRALDRGSFERLKWHINRVLTRKL